MRLSTLSNAHLDLSNAIHCMTPDNRPIDIRLSDTIDAIYFAADNLRLEEDRAKRKAQKPRARRNTPAT